MKCPNCNAETKDAKFCEYCGSELPKEKSNINITNNYYGTDNKDNGAGKCPKCHGNNVKFKREKLGTVGSSHSRKGIISPTRDTKMVRQEAYRTIGMCQDCGYTWDPNNGADNKKSKGCLWWFLMLCIWPIALSVWFYKTDKIKLDKKYRLGIIVVFLAIVMIIGKTSDTEEASTPDTQIETTVESESTVEDTTEEVVETEPAVEEVVLEYFESDELVNEFFVKYNDVADDKIPAEEIKRGNIRTKALSYHNNIQLEVINVSDEYYSVKIGSKREDEDTVIYEGFKNAMIGVAGLTEDDVNEVWNILHESGYSEEVNKYDGVKISYIPSVELSWGFNDPRIDLEITIK